MGKQPEKHEAWKPTETGHLSNTEAAALYNRISTDESKWAKDHLTDAQLKSKEQHLINDLNKELKGKLPPGVHVSGFEKNGNLILTDTNAKDGKTHLYVVDEHGKVAKSLVMGKDSHGAYSENTNKTEGSTTKQYTDGHSVKHYRDNSEVTTDAKGHPTEIKDKNHKVVCKAEYDKEGNITKFTDHGGYTYNKGTGDPPKWSCTKPDGKEGNSWTGTIKPDGKGGIVTDDGAAGAGHKYRYDHTGIQEVKDAPSSTTGDRSSNKSETLTTPPNGKPVDMVHPQTVGGDHPRMFGAAGSPDDPAVKGKNDGNMIVTVPLDANGKPTGPAEQVKIDGLKDALHNTGGDHPGASNPAVFTMPDGKVAMVFEVDKKEGTPPHDYTSHSDFYLAVSEDHGKSFTVANGGKPVMSGSGNDQFISVPRVEKNPTDGSYSMYFCKTGRNASGRDHNTVAVATSKDGQHWGKETDIEVKGLPKDAAVMDPDVHAYVGTDHKTHYRMVFTTNNSPDKYDTDQRTTIWEADSTDEGKTFTKPHEVVKPSTGATKVMDPQVVTMNGKTYIQYVEVEGKGKDQKMKVMRQPFEE